MANREKRKRQPIDMMIDAHVWMRRQARLRGEWTGGDQVPTKPKTIVRPAADSDPTLSPEQ